MTRGKAAAKLAHLNYEDEFQYFSANVNRAARAFYYNLALYEYAMAGDANINVLNQNPLFWNDFQEQTVISVFIILGRIFDNKPKARNIDKFMSVAEGSDYFQKKNLRSRKMIDHTEEPEWLGEYMLHAHVLDSNDFCQLRAFVKAISGEWERIKPIRHKFIAHQEIFPNEYDKNQLLGKSDAEAIESIILKLLTVVHILQEAGWNGKRPDYDYVSTQIKDLVYREMKKMFCSLQGSMKEVGA